MKKRNVFIAGAVLLLIVLVSLLPLIVSNGRVQDLFFSRIADRIPGSLSVAGCSIGWQQGLQCRGLVYDDKAPWPEQADGEGATLELLNPFRDNRLAENWAASAGHGTPGRQNSVFTSVKMKNKSPLVQDFILFQNYPNPFNPQTKIVYQLAKGGDVHLAVYDALGRIVSVLVQGKQAAGKHSVIFKADHLASGIYFCVLKYNHSGTRIKKIVLLR